MKLDQAWQKIILIDDDFVYNLINEKFLKLIGFPGQIIPFTDANEALKFIQQPSQMEEFKETKRPSLVLLDLNMPRLNGWGFLDIFQNFDDEVKKAFKVVVLTSSIDPLDMDKAAGYPSVEYFEVKPLKLETIYKLINRLEPKINDLL